MKKNHRLPLISIVTVSFNAAETIEKTIQSVLALNYPNFEFLVIDGGSTDDTIQRIKKYESQIDYWTSERDKGIYDGMNKGIQAAKGEWINFMNCGDRFASPDALDFFEKEDIVADVVYGDALIEYPTFTMPFQNLPIEQMWRRMPLCHQAAFAKLEVMREFRFDLQYRLSSDFDFFYRAWLAGKQFKYVKKLVCFFDFTSGASIKHVFRSVKERKEIVLRHSFDLRKWIYHSVTIGYIYTSYYAKRMIGKHLTNRVTHLLKRLRPPRSSDHS